MHFIEYKWYRNRKYIQLTRQFAKAMENVTVLLLQKLEASLHIHKIICFSVDGDARPMITTMY